jgi:16S rRNA (adenine1518-N6/adenine1519-N6)-dimethyltransferase
VRLAGPFEGRAVIEVGPGPGGLTRALLESDAGKVVLVEKDPRFLPLLAELDDGEGRMTVVEADALKVREADLVEGPAHVVSNLPYNVGTPLLIKWLTGPWTPHVPDPDVPEGSRRADRRGARATTPTAGWR